MVDRHRVGVLGGVFALGVVVGACVLAISAPALQSAQDAPAGVTYQKNALGMEFVTIPAGQFQMGCSEGTKPNECGSDERPRHAVQITKPFEMGKTEVTQKQYQAIVGSDPSQYTGDNLPVEQVSFEDVQAFLTKLNAKNDGYLYRLPTEAEWEYAARAGTTDQFAGAFVPNPLVRFAKADDAAVYNVDQTTAVASKKPNAWGIYDMRGNVAEWVQDWYDPMYYGSSPAADPKGPATGDARVVRGGSFHSYPWLTRVSIRTQFPEGYSLYDTGFRLVREKR
jgi:formylglycine-generating enzyme required for sulfatase activity